MTTVACQLDCLLSLAPWIELVGNGTARFERWRYWWGWIDAVSWILCSL